MSQTLNAQYRIDQWFYRLEQTNGRMTREDVCFLMVQTRHLIEVASTPEQYRVATFYANWIVHPALDRFPVCFDVLKDITRILAENSNPTSSDITREISRIIGFPQLRSELMKLFSANRLPLILFDSRENWKKFVECLLWFLAGQPVSFPENPKGSAKKIRDEILALPRPYNILVESLAIENHQGVYHWLLDVSGDKKIRMMGQVEIAEAEETFSAPSQTG